MQNSTRALAITCLLATAGRAAAQLPGTCLDVQQIGEWYPVYSTAAGPGAWVPPPKVDDFLYDFPLRAQLGDSTFGYGLEVIIPENSRQTPHRYRIWGAVVIRLSSC